MESALQGVNQFALVVLVRQQLVRKYRENAFYSIVSNKKIHPAFLYNTLLIPH